MLSIPTIGTYHRKRIRRVRMKQVNTNNPMKIRFCGLFPKCFSYHKIRETDSLSEEGAYGDRMSRKKVPGAHSLSSLQLDFPDQERTLSCLHLDEL